MHKIIRDTCNGRIKYLALGGWKVLPLVFFAVFALIIGGRAVLAQSEVRPDVTITSPQSGSTTDQDKIDVAVNFRASANPANRPNLPTGNVHTVVLEIEGVEVARHENPPQTKEGGHTFNVDISSHPDGIITLQAFAYQGNVQAGLVGNSDPVSLVIDRIPVVAIISPANLTLFSSSPISVSGTLMDASAVSVNGVPATVTKGVFIAQVPLVEGNNTITAAAQDLSGDIRTSSIQVTLDTTPPTVTIDSPPDGFITSSPLTTVAGMINDIVVGTVNGDQAQVTVNGIPADVSNRSFLAVDVPLVLGPNTITATGTDKAGNTDSTSITVNFQQIIGQPQISLVSGNNQTGPIGVQLPDPLMVTLTDASDNPVPGENVIFKVVENNGTLSNSPGDARSLAVQTDSLGHAQVNWTLGGRAGAGNNVVEATAVGFSGTSIFTATADTAVADKINLDAGNNQTGEVSQPLPKPFIAVVTDAGHNRLGGVPVTYTVIAGGGNFNGQSSIILNTDSDGRALVALTLGPNAGFDNNVVEATFPGNPGFPATFIASGKVAGNPVDTSISGVVLDNTDQPIPGVTMHIEGTNLSTQTDSQGQFVFQPAPVGSIVLLADGSTAQRPGVWPALEFDLVTVAGQNNTIGMPIFLLPLDIPNGLLVDANTGGVLTLPEVPGFSLTVAPGSATFPDGSKSGTISVTLVHADKIPMVPNFGMQPRFIVTIQPAGVLFNPPAPITIPNVDGLGTGVITEMYSFDHDLGQFVSIGTGTVSDDGTVIASDPGVGIIKGGWHCGGSPASAGAVQNVTINVDKPIVTIETAGTSVEVTAIGGPLPSGTPAYSWTSADPNIASVVIKAGGSSQTHPNTAVITRVGPGRTTVTVTYKCDSGATATATIEVTDVRVEMTAFRPQTPRFTQREVPDHLEETPGVGVRINGDDDNSNGSSDQTDTFVSGEDDLIQVRLDVEPISSPNIEYVLKRSNANIRVWENQTKGSAILDSTDEEVLTFSGNTRTIWVENPSGGGSILELEARKKSDGSVIREDKIRFFSFSSVIIVLGGEGQSPTDPSAHGIFNSAIQLYQQGYDVHMYDEDVVRPFATGGLAQDEVESAVRERGVSQAAIFGFSHGGGATHDLAQRLGTVTISFTAYIDAIRQIVSAPETRLPPGTGFHVNYYQRKSLILKGDSVPGTDVPCNVTRDPCDGLAAGWGDQLVHSTIDDNFTVNNGILRRLTSIVPK